MTYRQDAASSSEMKYKRLSRVILYMLHPVVHVIEEIQIVKSITEILEDEVDPGLHIAVRAWDIGSLISRE